MEPRAVLLSLAVSAALAGAAAAQDLPEIQARGTLRLLAVTSAEQTFFVSDAPRGGFDWEMLEGFGKLHKVTLELVAVEAWDELVPALLKDRGDLIAGGFTATDPRRKQIAFTAETSLSAARP